MPQMSVPTLPGLGPHKIDIQQGNVITQEMIEKLQPGMTRNQVRFILGTPLLVDPFRTDRWDYVYSMKKRGEVVEQRQLKVFFKDDKMVRLEGDTTDGKPGVGTVAVTNAKPVGKPAAATSKPETVAATPKPEPAPPADVGKPQLQVAPSPGEPAKPEEIKAAQTAAPAPAGASAPAVPSAGDGMTAPPLDAPPMPRLEIKAEPSEPVSPFAASVDTSVSASVAPTPAKPAGDSTSKPAEKPAARPGFFGRLFASSPAKPEQKPVAQPQPKPLLAQPEPVVAPVAKSEVPAPKPPSPSIAATPPAAATPVPADKPAATKAVEKPVEKAVLAAPAQKPAGKPAAVQRGFFSRLLDAAANPAPPVRQGVERIAEPGSPPPPFVEPAPVPGKP